MTLMDEARREIEGDRELRDLYRHELRLLHGDTCPCEQCVAFRAMSREVAWVFACLAGVLVVIAGLVWAA